MARKKDEKQSYNLTALQYVTAGASTGVITRFLVQPLDVLKIHFQLQTTPSQLKKNSKYKSMIQATGVIIKEEGIFGLWKGHIPAQFLSIVFGAVQFSSYEAFSSYIQKNINYNFAGSDHLINIGAGSAAGLAASVASFPFDVVKTHLVFQSEPKLYKGMGDAVRKIYQKEGTKGFTKGMLPACLQTAPMSGLVFCFHGIFTKLYNFLFKNVNDKNTAYTSTFGNITSGLLAGLAAKTVVYPCDLMKKRLQVQGFSSHVSYSDRLIKCTGVLNCFFLTVQHEGFLGLFKGLYPSLLKAGATTSLYFTVYDKMCQLMEYSNTR